MSDSSNNISDTLDDPTCELLDLYVLDALEFEEVEKVEAILSQSKSARDYLDESRAVLANFEDNETPSPHLLESIKAQIFSQSNDSKNAEVVNIKSIRNQIAPFLTGAIAASFLAIMLSVALWPQSSNSGKEVFALDNQIGAFSDDVNTQTVSLKSDQGELGAKIMIHKDGDIMIDGRTLKALDDNSTYQLWAIVETATGRKVISAGVLGNNPSVTMARVSGNVVAFALTKEVSGGIDKSEQDPLFSASFT